MLDDDVMVDRMGLSERTGGQVGLNPHTESFSFADGTRALTAAVKEEGPTLA
jgi:hypothetical protein